MGLSRDGPTRRASALWVYLLIAFVVLHSSCVRRPRGRTPLGAVADGSVVALGDGVTAVRFAAMLGSDRVVEIHTTEYVLQISHVVSSFLYVVAVWGVAVLRLQATSRSSASPTS